MTPTSTPAQATAPDPPSRRADIARPPWLSHSSWPFTPRTLETGGSTVAYTDEGTGPTLLLVHVGMWSIIWRDVLSHLSGSYRCVTLDVPGTGLSGGPTSTPTLITAADAIDAVVHHLDLTDMTLVVHDLGAPATLEAAAGWTDRVAGLVVINGFGWRPSGPMFRGMLAIMGNPAVREVDAFTGWLIRVSATRFGVGRQWDRSTRLGHRRAHGLGRSAVPSTATWPPHAATTTHRSTTSSPSSLPDPCSPSSANATTRSASNPNGRTASPTRPRPP